MQKAQLYSQNTLFKLTNFQEEEGQTRSCLVIFTDLMTMNN